ncbi:unnamed protein product [Cunninghamella blakesleeana]
MINENDKQTIYESETQQENKGQHYFVMEEIGKGGYGVVKKAREESTLKIVAIKILPLNAQSMPNTTICEIAI